MDSKCALNKAPNENGSCLTDDHIELIEKYIGKPLEPDKMIQKLNCTDEICMINKINMPVNVAQRIEREAFKAPAESLKGNYWMNNTEIDTCLSQMRIQYPGFAHTFIHMSDMKSFDPVNKSSYPYEVKGLDQIDLAACIKSGIEGKPPCPGLSTYNNVPLKYIGTVFNTDTSKGSGQHWFSVLISFDYKDILDPSKPIIIVEVFNSSGTDITNGTFQKFWTDKCLEISKKTGYRCEKRLVSTIQHQRDDTGNCGSYSLFYIFCRLNNVGIHEFNKKKVIDENMERFRSKCFRLA